MSTDPQPPEGFDLDAEKSRQDEAAKQGIVARETDPVDEIGDPEEPDPADSGDVPDDNEIDDRDEAGPGDDV